MIVHLCVLQGISKGVHLKVAVHGFEDVVNGLKKKKRLSGLPGN